jgi:DEAD/DEAH box helicase domain-containing protein
MVSRLLEAVATSKDYARQVVHHEVIDAQAASVTEPQEPLAPELVSALSRLGIGSLYTHQAKALDAARAGRNVAVVTPTASGKTLVYNLPVLEAALKDETARALYLFPLKALEQDQQKALEELISAIGEAPPGLTTAIYDGDTPGHRRRKIVASPPTVLLSNPDMLHMGILAHHANWEEFFRNLRFVVLDELHTYRGVFGSHVGNILRRLNRICAHYGSSPQFITTSATTAEPKKLVEDLVGRPFTVIAESGAPRSARHFLFVNPTASPYTLAARLFADCLKGGLKTIVFTKARKITELIHMWTVEREAALASKISSYRAGFLPEERREIEEKLFSGKLWGVVSTSALEMGIDVGGLDACLLVGYPGTIMSTWQRGGRVGRAEKESLVVLIAQADALDQYFMRHPEDFFRRGFERAVVDPANEPILKAHLTCAASELPLTAEEEAFSPVDLRGPLEALSLEGRLLKAVSDGLWHSVRRRPHRLVDIREAGEAFTILEEPGQEVVGTVSGPRAYSEGHQGAIYLHRARQYESTRFDIENRNIFVRPVEVAYYTQPLHSKETTILETHDKRPAGNFVINRGRLRVTQRVVGYEKRRIAGQELLSAHELEMPELTFETVGLWIEIEEAIRRLAEGPAEEYMGGLHAVEHAAIALFPLVAMCDRHDVGGICYPVHPQVGKGAIFIYDGYEGGVGLAERVYEEVEGLLEATLSLLMECPCLEGCPSCIHSPKCGSGNKPLNKTSAVLILKALLGQVDLERAEALQSEAEEDETWSPVKVSGARPPERGPRLVFFDLETQRGAQEVGGWSNKHLMRLAVGVLYDTAEEAFFTYYEDQALELVSHLKRADLVVGFNIIRFDYEVLKAYTTEDLRRLPAFDILQDIYRRLGFRLSLGHLVEHTLGKEKTADGLQSLEWFKEGRLDLVTSYCTDDVALTRDLFYYGLEHRHLLFERQGAGRVQMSVDWDLERMMARPSPA